MTNTERVQQQIRLHNRYAKQFRPLVKLALKDQYNKAISSLHLHGPEYVLNHKPDALINPKLSATIMRIYLVCASAKATLTYRELQRVPKVQKKANGVIGFNLNWTNKIVDYFTKHLFDKVVLPISQTTETYIDKVIKQGVKEGWSIDRMVQDIERTDYLDGRVERILRTEINRAVNYGNTLAAKAIDFKVNKTWVSVDDHRTRPAHRQADGQTVPIDEKFFVDNEYLDQPGDPEGSPENTINCRCVSTIEPVRDERGRLQSIEPDEPVERVTGEVRQRTLDAIDALLR